MPGTVLLLAASPLGKGRLVDAAGVLPVLAAVAPAVLSGTDTANVVELADPLDPQGVLTRLRAAAAAPGPLTLYITGQLQLDRRQRLPHLALARTTPATVRYTALPWHWIREELRLRSAADTALVVDLHADAETWRYLAERPLESGPNVAVYGRIAPPGGRRIAEASYMKAVATLLRSGRRPALAELHEQAWARIAGAGVGRDVVLGGVGSGPGGSAPRPPLAHPPTRLGQLEGEAGIQFGGLEGAAGVRVGGLEGAAGVRVGGLEGAAGVRGGGLEGEAGVRGSGLEGEARIQFGGLEGAAGVRGSGLEGAAGVRVGGLEGAAGVRGGGVEGPVGVRGGGSEGAVGVPVGGLEGEAGIQFGGLEGAARVRGGGVEGEPGWGRSRQSGAAGVLDPHAAISVAVQAGRHGDADVLAARYEEAAIRGYGPVSDEALHWAEVRADLAMFAGDAVRSCRAWMGVAGVRLAAGQAGDAPAVEAAVDRAHHQWGRIEDAARARELGPALAELRLRVPGRRQGALENVQRQLRELQATR
ncbi:hypothetical protein ABZ865_17145 [Streptomyces sp. NPDC047085]|uniref:hypothetical protein n=1 Tax=Streptomyces sp. NPDC047085 TaxID=3155140 RepID=UPI0034079410